MQCSRYAQFPFWHYAPQSMGNLARNNMVRLLHKLWKIYFTTDPVQIIELGHQARNCLVKYEMLYAYAIRFCLNRQISITSFTSCLLSCVHLCLCFVYFYFNGSYFSTILNLCLFIVSYKCYCRYRTPVHQVHSDLV